jgi:imidazolonepropionase-like amidohydrolase
MTLKAIVGATVIDGTGADPLPDAVVLVEGERVRSVSAGARPPDGAEVVDAQGKYVIPGLIDANAHLTTWVPDIALRYEGRYAELAEEGAQVLLRSGVTTLFDTKGYLAPLTEVRDRIASGATVGCRLFIAGNIIGLDGPFSADFFSSGGALGADTVGRINAQVEQGVGGELLRLTPDEVRARVRGYVERTGVDFLKYASSGHGKQRHHIAFSERTQRAIVEEGHNAGLTVQAHTTTVESLWMAIDAGADLLQHGNLTSTTPMPEETLKTIVDWRTPVAALIYTDRQHAWMAEHGNHWVRTYTINETTDQNNRRLIAAGARLLLTTDAFALGPVPRRHPSMTGLLECDDPLYILGESHTGWLRAAVERGMAPMEALLSATRHVAEAYGKLADLGTLEPGKRADLLVLDGDPLEEVRNYDRIARVMKDGTFVDRDALPLRPVLTADVREP